MNRIDKLVFKAVILSVAVVVALTATVDLVFTLAEELAESDENYSAAQAILFSIQTLPTAVYELLPFSALGGALIGLGILASHNELLVIQTAGVPNWRIIWSVLQPTLLVMITSLVLGEYIAPPLEHFAQSQKSILLAEDNDEGSLQDGTWQRIGNEFVHIGAILPGGRDLVAITRFRLDDQRQLVSSSIADSARYIGSDGEGFWELRNIKETFFGPASVATSFAESLNWEVDLSPELLSVLLVEPQRQSISGLYRFAQYFQNEGLDADNYYLAFWKKILQPLSTLALVLLAVSFVFGPLRQATMGYRVFIAISIGLIFTILQRLLEPASLLYGISPVIAVLLPVLLAMVLGSVLLSRVR